MPEKTNPVQPAIVLGSASSARAGILTRAGLNFTTVVAEVDETALTVELGEVTPAALAEALAQAKAENVATQVQHRLSDALVIGADSVFDLDGVAYGKPLEPKLAIERWKAQRGKTGTLHTGHSLYEIRDGEILRQASRVDSAQVSFASVTDEDIERYVATGEPLGCAGGFTLEGYGAAMIDSVAGDPNTVLGLSVNVLRQMLTDWEYSLTSFWQTFGNQETFVDIPQ